MGSSEIDWTFKAQEKLVLIPFNFSTALLSISKADTFIVVSVELDKIFSLCLERLSILEESPKPNYKKIKKNLINNRLTICITILFDKWL